MILRKVTISGSYRKFPEDIAAALERFRDLGIQVLSPKSATIVSSVDGFVSLEKDIIQKIDAISQNDIASAMRLIENSHLSAIQQSDALWLAIPQGYCGIATSFEIGWALAHNVPVFYDKRYIHQVQEPILRSYAIPTKGIEDLVHHFESMPPIDPQIPRYFMKAILLPTEADTITGNRPRYNADVAIGPVIVDFSKKRYTCRQPRDILLVKTYKWRNKFSIVGGRIKPAEKIEAAFSRIMAEQTGLQGRVAEEICVFDELPDAGYYQTGTSRIFVDKVVKVQKRKIRLDSRAQEYVWMPAKNALQELDLEPNARKTIELYHRNHCHYA